MCTSKDPLVVEMNPPSSAAGVPEAGTPKFAVYADGGDKTTAFKGCKRGQFHNKRPESAGKMNDSRGQPIAYTGAGGFSRGA